MRNRPQRQVGAGRFERLGHALEIPTNTGDAFNKVLTVATEPVGYSEFPYGSRLVAVWCEATQARSVDRADLSLLHCFDKPGIVFARRLVKCDIERATALRRYRLQ